MAHFDLFTWQIDLSEYHSSQLDSDPLVQGIFAHEYIHYCQILCSTIGRVLLVELVRVAILAGLHKYYDGDIPEEFDQINLHEQLMLARKEDFVGTKIKSDFHDIEQELEAAVNCTFESASPPADLSYPFMQDKYKFHEIEVDSFPFMLIEYEDHWYRIPISDRLIMENMARQIQRNFVRFTNDLDISSIEAYRANPGEVVYTCIHDYLEGLIPNDEYAATWTITLCQICLLCGKPGFALMRIIDRLNILVDPDLDTFLNFLKEDSWFRDNYNNPNFNEIAQGLMKTGTAMKPTENYQLNKLIKQMVELVNTVNFDKTFFTEVLLDWQKLGHWVARFGCPPIIFSDKIQSKIFDLPTNQHWHSYLIRTREILS